MHATATLGVPVAPGVELAGYRIESVLGEGGMGVVYLATQIKLDRKVALKVLSPAFAGDEEFRQRFVRESYAAAALDDPNILPIYDAGEADGHLYIAMRYIDGADLGHILQRRGPLGPRHVLALVEQIGGALDAAHRTGLVHHDVKPANILIDRNGVAYLCDFGLARRSGADLQARPGHFLGTVGYCAPEQISGRKTDWRTDLYALGAVAFQALTGKPPFERRTETETARAHLDDAVPAASRSRRGLPRGIDPVLATALAKDPDKRHSTAAAFADALADALDEDRTMPAAFDWNAEPSRAPGPAPAGGGRLTEETLRAAAEKSRGPIFRRTPSDRPKTRLQKAVDPKKLTKKALQERLEAGRGPLRWREVKNPSPPTRLHKVQQEDSGRLTDDVLRAKIEEEKRRRAGAAGK